HVIGTRAGAPAAEPRVQARRLDHQVPALEIGIEQRYIQQLPFAALLAIQQRGHDRAVGAHRGHRIAHREAGQHRRAVGKAQRVDNSGVRRRDIIVAGLGCERTGLAEARYRAHYDRRVNRLDHLVGKADPPDNAGREVLDQYVDSRQHLFDDRQPRRGLQIDAQALLAPIESHEVAAAAVLDYRDVARVVATRRFDLDDFGARLGHRARAHRTRDVHREVQYLVAAKRPETGLLRHGAILRERRG